MHKMFVNFGDHLWLDIYQITAVWMEDSKTKIRCDGEVFWTQWSPAKVIEQIVASGPGVPDQ